MGIEALSLNKMGISGAQISIDLKPAVRARVGMVRRFRRWIEESDWDDRILKRESRIDLVCWAAVLACAICVLPAIIRALL